MFGEKALELIKQLQRAGDGPLPPFDEDLIRQALEEMRVLFEENQKEVSAAVDGEQGLFSGVQLRHASLERNKRCILAYLYNRMMKMRKYRWDIGSVLPAEIKLNLCEQEVQWFNKYNKSLANYMKSIGGIGFDLTQVRCLVDYGEFETEDGTIILLKKNSQHYLPRSQCEHLIRQEYHVYQLFSDLAGAGTVPTTQLRCKAGTLFLFGCFLRRQSCKEQREVLLAPLASPGNINYHKNPFILMKPPFIYKFFAVAGNKSR